MGRSKRTAILLIFFFINSFPAVNADENSPKRKSWKYFRDLEVEKQNLDYSCGAASLATILRHYYGLPVTETIVLEKIPDMDGDLSASFLELKVAANSLGFEAVGVELSFSQLKYLRTPAIAHLSYEGRQHFTVIRGIDVAAGLVSVADPSWGNRQFRRERFLSMWSVSNDVGRLLIVTPRDRSAKVRKDFYSPLSEQLELAKKTLRDRILWQP